MLNRALLKEIVLEQRAELQQPDSTPFLGVQRSQLQLAHDTLAAEQVTIITGVRRCGKSTLVKQLIKKIGLDKIHYLNFEDERLTSFNVDMFNSLLEIFYEINGKQNIFFFDEIQVIEGWERFVRRLHDSHNKIVITGSNANLLSKELGTKLTGRHLDIELFPFSFTEYLLYYNYALPANPYLTEERGNLQRLFNDYLRAGGMPSYLRFPHREVLTGIYEDVIYRDILQRYHIDNSKTFRELSLYLLSNTTSAISFNKLKEYFHLGSVNTVIKYIDYLANSYLLFIVNPFSASLRKQINAPKKIYAICNSFIEHVGFHISHNQGILLENLVFLQLRRANKIVYYYRTEDGLEIDFLLHTSLETVELIQVTQSLSDPRVRKREVTALITAMNELNCNTGLILTESEQEKIAIEGKEILVMPIYEWLLSS